MKKEPKFGCFGISMVLTLFNCVSRRNLYL